MRNFLPVLISVLMFSACVPKEGTLDTEERPLLIEITKFQRDADGNFVSEARIRNASEVDLCVLGDDSDYFDATMTNYTLGKELEFSVHMFVTVAENSMYDPFKHPLFIMASGDERTLMVKLPVLEDGSYSSDGVADRHYKKGDLMIAQLDFLAFKCSQVGGRLRQTGDFFLASSNKSTPFRPSNPHLSDLSGHGAEAIPFFG